MRRRLLPLFGFVATLLALALAPSRAQAQIGSATDIITGLVRDSAGPIEGAVVQAYSLETQVTRTTRTDARGRFTILFPDGGGQYRMQVSAIGMTPRIELIQRHADEDRLVWNVRLATGAVTLTAINVRSGPQIVRVPEGPTPGSSERAFGADQLSRLPTDVSDLTLLASLVPGVVSIAGSDSTANSFSVAGLGADANALTLDGLLFGSSAIPQEGLRQTRVVTNTYDVSRGQFSGGLIASTTRSGSNIVQGSSQYQLRDQDLAITEDSSAFAQGFTQHILSGGVGGPIVKDRLFIFGSGQARLRDDPQQTLVSATSNDFTRLGVSPDSVVRFNYLVDSLLLTTSHPVPHLSVPGSDTRANNNYSALARMDYVLSNSHTLTLRGDWRGTSQDPARVGSLGLPQTGGQLTSSGGGFMGTVTSRFGATLINELRGYLQGSRSDGDAFTPIPAGRVQVASDLPGGSRGVTTLVFGGNAGLPSRSRSRSFEATNELSWLPGTGGHRVKIGATWVTEQTHDIIGNNQLGTFTYLSLADLAAGQPATFRRTVDVTERESQNYRWGLYAGDVWVIQRPFQLTYGLRLEGSSFGNPPAYNPAVETTFGLRTDHLPREVHLSPRAGFTWTLGGQPFPGAGGGGGGFGGGGFQAGRFTPPTLVIRGGVGEFRSQPPTNLVVQARSATGLATSSGEVVCNGGGVPTPDWGGYWTDPGSIPDQCSSAGPPPPSGFTPPRSVALLAPGFEAPRAWRGSLAIEKRLTQIFRLSVEGSFARGIAQYGFRDLNLNATPRFVLASEGSRPVYVPAGDITPTTGAPRFAASRVDSAFGTVLEARSNLRSSSEQVTFSLGGVVGRGIQLSTSYTWQHARSEATGARGGATAGDPNVAEWSRSELERRHSFLATITYPLSQSLEVTSIGRFSSGAPYTPTVGGDVNGDGMRNDRAFIFAPGAGTPEAIGMQSLLAQASSGVRACLQRQVGTIASRSSCVGPWQYSLDFQLNWRPTFFSLNRRLTVSLVTQNFLRGLDELLHSPANEKGWGLVTRPDNTLLYVTGFDSLAHTYSYSVNERFGATYGSATAFRPPFQLGIQMRMAIGPDRQRQALDAMRAGNARGAAEAMRDGPGGGAFRGPATSMAEIIQRIEAAMPNPAAQVLELNDSLQLQLDSAQIQLLTPIRDTLAAHNQMRLDSLRSATSGIRGTPGPNDFLRIMPLMGPIFNQGRTEVQQTLTTVRAILRPEQWAKLPETVRDPQAGARQLMFGPGQRPGEGQRRPEERRGRP
jgi:hypothetical protein